MSGPHRGRWLALGIVAVLVVVGLSIALVAALLRPAETVASPAATPSATPPATAQGTPQPSPTSTGPSVEEVQQHQQYRTYVSTLVQGGTAVIASLGGLSGCRDSRPECVARLGQASDEVATLKRDLSANPAPSCLVDADQRLQDALSFQQSGLDTAQSAVRSENRVRLVQGLLLTGVGLWRAGQAIVAGRESNC